MQRICKFIYITYNINSSEITGDWFKFRNIIAFLLSIMGSPDERQIDGMGGANPLTSKVAIVSRSDRDGVDVDYLFLQVSVDKNLVSDTQNCGNILSGVAPFAIERGLVKAAMDTTRVSIYMENSGKWEG